MSEDPADNSGEISSVAQFGPVAHVLQGIFARHKSIFEVPADTANENLPREGERILSELHQAQVLLDQKELLLPYKVGLLYGLTNRNVAMGLEYDRGKAFEDLYSQLSSLADGKPRNFYDFFKETEMLAKLGQIVPRRDEEGSSFPSIGSKTSALVDLNGDLEGIQLHLGPNISVNFVLGNYSNPDKTESRSLVNLYVLPDGFTRR